MKYRVKQVAVTLMDESWQDLTLRCRGDLDKRLSKRYLNKMLTSVLEALEQYESQKGIKGENEVS